MLRPDVYRQPHVALQHIPYICGGGSTIRDSSSGGVLGRGQTVWTSDNCQSKTYQSLTSAFVEGIGIVSLDPRWLVRADVLSERTEETYGKVHQTVKG